MVPDVINKKLRDEHFGRLGVGCTPVVLACGSLRQAHNEFEASLGYPGSKYKSEDENKDKQMNKKLNFGLFTGMDDSIKGKDACLSGSPCYVVKLLVIISCCCDLSFHLSHWNIVNKY